MKMKVGELIQELIKLDPEMDVLLDVPNIGFVRAAGFTTRTMFWSIKNIGTTRISRAAIIEGEEFEVPEA